MLTTLYRLTPLHPSENIKNRNENKKNNSKKKTDLGREISDDISSVASPKRQNTFILNSSSKAVGNSLVWLREPTRLDHLILILNQKLNSLNWSSCSLGNSSRNSSHKEIHHKSSYTFLCWGLHKYRRNRRHKCQASALTSCLKTLQSSINITSQAIVPAVHIGGKPRNEVGLPLYFLENGWMLWSICHVCSWKWWPAKKIFDVP